MSSLKAEKESFVSGHGGTTVFEIATVLVSLLAGYALRNVLLVCFPGLARATRLSSVYGLLCMNAYSKFLLAYYSVYCRSLWWLVVLIAS